MCNLFNLVPSQTKAQNKSDSFIQTSKSMNISFCIIPLDFPSFIFTEVALSRQCHFPKRSTHLVREWFIDKFFSCDVFQYRGLRLCHLSEGETKTCPVCYIWNWIANIVQLYLVTPRKLVQGRWMSRYEIFL